MVLSRTFKILNKILIIIFLKNNNNNNNNLKINLTHFSHPKQSSRWGGGI